MTRILTILLLSAFLPSRLQAGPLAMVGNGTNLVIVNTPSFIITSSSTNPLTLQISTDLFAWTDYTNGISPIVVAKTDADALRTATSYSFRVAWNPSTDPAVIGTVVAWGQTNGAWTGTIDSGTNDFCALTTTGGLQWYVAAKVYDCFHVESDYSPAIFVSSNTPGVRANYSGVFFRSKQAAGPRPLLAMKGVGLP